MRSSKGIVEATTESFSWRFRTFIQKYTNYSTMQKCNAKCQMSGVSTAVEVPRKEWWLKSLKAPGGSKAVSETVSKKRLVLSKRNKS